jgi:hypothetical protein
MEDGLTSRNRSPLDEALASTIFGGRIFVEEIEALHLSGAIPTRDLPGLRQMKSRFPRMSLYIKQMLLLTILTDQSRRLSLL